METGTISISKMREQEPMVEADNEHDEVNKTAEDMVKRGSVMHGGDDEGVIIDGDARRQDGMSEANLPKSNCKFYRKKHSINQMMLYYFQFRTI